MVTESGMDRYKSITTYCHQAKFDILLTTFIVSKKIPTLKVGRLADRPFSWLSHPDMTFTVDWALKTNYLSSGWLGIKNQLSIYHSVGWKTGQTVIYYLFIYWRLIVIAQSTAHGHLKAFHKFNSHTSWIQHKTQTLYIYKHKTYLNIIRKLVPSALLSYTAKHSSLHGYSSQTPTSPPPAKDK